jgi:class 3 adenylate cyclase
VAYQLLDEEADPQNRYTWRHALTQEAIVGDTVLPKRLRAHSRAADALLASGGGAAVVARHLLAAERAGEALEACLRAADEAERASGYHEASDLIERVLPHVDDPVDRARLLYRMGRLRWLNGEPRAAEQLLADAIRRLDEGGLAREAAEARVHLSRCYWELDRPDESMHVAEEAREVLEREGPSADLAHAYIRISGLHSFALDYERGLAAAERGVEVAEQASADPERLWALSFAALAALGTAREYELFAAVYEEAIEKGYSIVAGNTTYNEIWSRVHTLHGGLAEITRRWGQVPYTAAALGYEVSKSWAHVVQGEPREALEQARLSAARHHSQGNPKFEWRAQLAVAEALLELGRIEEAAQELPPESVNSELQDVIYDTPGRVGVAIALGRGDEAAELGRRAASHVGFLRSRSTVAFAVEGLLAGEAVDEAEEVLERAKRVPVEVGEAGIDLAEGQVLLARGQAAQARPLLERALEGFRAAGLSTWEWRAAVVAGQAAAEADDAEAARQILSECVAASHAAGAIRARDAALATAERFSLEIPVPEDVPDAEAAAPDFLPAGERMVTSMFADVRGYTPMAAASAPAELADRMTTLHRWAAAEVGKRQGIVDKFAGDAVMATFNATGARVDHATLALDAALALRDKAALMDLPVGIGIAVGPAVVSRSVDEQNVSVLGSTTNLAARLQTAAGGGDILLSDEAHRRVASWLAERGLTAEPEQLELKGFEGVQPAYRLASTVRS